MKLFLALTLLGSVVTAEKERVLRPSGGTEQQLPCTLLQYHLRYTNGTSISGWRCELASADASASGEFRVDIDGLGADILEHAASGTTSLFVPGGTIENGRLTIPPGSDPTLGRVERGQVLAAATQDDQDPSRRLNLGVASQHKVLVARVIAADAAVGSSAIQLRNFVFGTTGDVCNLKERYQACSYGELTMVPFNGNTAKNVFVTNGVYELTIPDSVVDQEIASVETIVKTALGNKLGDLESQFHHVIMCIPPGTLSEGDSEWVAYAYINDWLGIYNDVWCNSPSTQVHEIGHNLNLQHSSEIEGGVNVEYGDETCMMGFSYIDDTTRKCFNPAKSAQLGWYSKRTITLDFTRRGGFKGDLIGVMDYQHANSAGKYVYVKIPGKPYNLAVDYYVGFNLALGINSGVNEAQNLVTVYRMQPVDPVSGESSPSWRIASLNRGQFFVIPNVSGTRSLTIRVNSINGAVSPRVASVSIFLAGCPPGFCSVNCRACCSAADCPLADPCVSVSCGDGSCSYDTSLCDGPAVIGGLTVPTC